jgi:hypothetical protein
LSALRYHLEGPTSPAPAIQSVRRSHCCRAFYSDFRRTLSDDARHQRRSNLGAVALDHRSGAVSDSLRDNVHKISHTAARYSAAGRASAAPSALESSGLSMDIRKVDGHFLSPGIYFCRWNDHQVSRATQLRARAGRRQCYAYARLASTVGAWDVGQCDGIDLPVPDEH